MNAAHLLNGMCRFFMPVDAKPTMGMSGRHLKNREREKWEKTAALRKG